MPIFKWRNLGSERYGEKANASELSGEAEIYIQSWFQILCPSNPWDRWACLSQVRHTVCWKWTCETQNKFHIFVSGCKIGVATVQWTAVSVEMERGRVRAGWSLSVGELGFVSAPATVQQWLCRYRTQRGPRLLVRSCVRENKRQWQQTRRIWW